MMDTASLISEIQSRPAQTIVCDRILVPIDGLRHPCTQWSGQSI